MDFDVKSLTEILESVDLDNLPVNVGLHRRDVKQVGIKDLAERIAACEGKFVRFGNRTYHSHSQSRDSVKFKVGKKGLFVQQRLDGKKELRIGTWRSPNWALKNKREGFVLRESSFSKNSEGVVIPIPYSRSRIGRNEGTFSPRGGHLYPLISSSLISDFEIDCELGEGFEFQNRLVDYRRKVIPIKVSIPDGLKYENSKHSLMLFWNGLLDEGLLKHDYEQRFYPRFSAQSGISRVGDILDERYEPNHKELMKFDRSFNPKVDEIARTVQRHLLGTYVINQVGASLQDFSKQQRMNSRGHGFNGEIASFSGTITEDEPEYKPYKGFCSINVNPNYSDSPDFVDAWVRPFGTKFRDALLEFDRTL